MCIILWIYYKRKIINKKDYILSVIKFINVKKFKKVCMLYYAGSILHIIDFQQETWIAA